MSIHDTVTCILSQAILPTVSTGCRLLSNDGENG